jgi:hypothetical protein
MAGGQVPLTEGSAERTMVEIEKRFLNAMEEAGEGESLL